MIFNQVQGSKETYKLQTIATTYETIVPAPNKVWTLESILFANTSASAVGVTLEIYDGATATVLLPAKSVDANDIYPFKDHEIILGPSELLRVKASTADVVDVTAVGYYGNQTG